MDIFKENTIINKFDELEQALLLFSVQTKHIDEISENDCKLIASLLEELKLLRAREMQHYDTDNGKFNTNIKYDYNTYVNAIQRAFNDGECKGRAEMNDIDLQIEQIESAREELKKHFGEYYELSALKNTIPMLEELKARRVIHIQAEKEYFNGFNRALDEVDEIITEQLDKSDNQVECQTLRWVLDVLSDLIE